MTFTVVPNINLQAVDYADAKETVQEVPQFIGEGANALIQSGTPLHFFAVTFIIASLVCLIAFVINSELQDKTIED